MRANLFSWQTITGTFHRVMHDEDIFAKCVMHDRMGVPGWTYAEGEDMDGNVGMLDCMAAAEWTSQYIHRFGGDGNRITAIGQSAGSGMMYYMMVAYGGRRRLPFQQVRRAFSSYGSAL